MLGIVWLWLAVYLSGMLISKLSGEKETSQLWIHLTGFFFLFFSQGTVFTIAQLLGWSFGQARNLLLFTLAAVSGGAVFVCKKELADLPAKIKRAFSREEGKSLYFALIGWLWVGILMVVSRGMVLNRQDALLETMQTTLLTDTMNRVHPFTGQTMELGVIFSRKIQTLPFWYAALQNWTGFSAQDTVWVCGSFFTITFSLLAFGELASLLFGRDFRKTLLFVCMMELLILSGDYFRGATGYRMLFYGYAGETIVGAVAIPAILIILYRLFAPYFHGQNTEAEARDRIGVWGAALQLGLVMAASVFLTSLFWGPVLLVITIILCLLCLGGVCLIRKLREK